MNWVTDLGELDEDEMLLRAIAMSLEKEEGEEEESKVAEDELSFARLQESGELLKKTALKKQKHGFLSDLSINFFS